MKPDLQKLIDQSLHESWYARALRSRSLRIALALHRGGIQSVRPSFGFMSGHMGDPEQLILRAASLIARPYVEMPIVPDRGLSRNFFWEVLRAHDFFSGGCANGHMTDGGCAQACLIPSSHGRNARLYGYPTRTEMAVTLALEIVVVFDEVKRLVPCTLHPAPCTLHPAPCTLIPVSRLRFLEPRYRTQGTGCRVQ